jgi:aspartyl-tRNA(Asn)/glutamyl-tRNA(Gln) amidotransferase subunit A
MSAKTSPLGAHLDLPDDRRAANLAHAVMLSETAAEVARRLPLSADVDDFRRDLVANACPRTGDMTKGAVPTAHADAGPHASARAMAQAIAEKKLDPVAAVTRTVEALQRAHERTHCLLEIDTTAEERAKKRGPGPLSGVPLAHKDMFDRKGKIATWGARVRAAEPAKRDAAVLERLSAAGSIQVASLHLTEFAFGPTGHNYVLGHARNPWNTAHITGGSSSGTAASVAMGAIPAGLGSDTAGSLRLPAAACGVTSIKPTWSRVSRRGAMPLALVFDCLGVIARHVDDLALLTGLLAGHDPDDGHTAHVPVPNYLAALGADVKGVRVGLPKALWSEAHADVQAHLGRALEQLKKAGLAPRDVEFKDWTTIDRLAQLVQFPDAASAHYTYMQTRSGEYGPQVRARLEGGHFIGAVDHMTGLRARGTMLRQTLATSFADADVLLMPVFADPLPTIAELDVASSPTLQATMARVVKYCRPFNYLGLPAITLPCPRAASDLPCGFQLVGKPFSEPLLFALGAAYQRLVPPMVAA